MIRAIVLLLILAALAVLAIQNFSTPVALVILSSRTGEIPFGLLLVGAVGVGALVSLILYGLLSLRRSPESKYRPLGRRVPYPESPRDTSLPPSSPPYSSSAPYSSAAFVTEPSVTPQDSASGSPATEYSDTFPEAAYRPSPPPPPPEKKKSPPHGDSGRRRSSGDDWGETRTAAQRDSWDEGGGPADGEQRGLFDFIRPDSGRGNAAQLTDEIAEGWDESAARYEYPAAYPANDDGRYEPGYDDGLDRGWERGRYDEAPPNPAYERRVYQDGLYGENDLEGSDFFEEGVYSDENRPGEIGPDGVYEADYRVITPPSQSLDDDEDKDYS